MRAGLLVVIMTGICRAAQTSKSSATASKQGNFSALEELEVMSPVKLDEPESNVPPALAGKVSLLGFGKEELRKKTPEEKRELTKKLTAEEWNEFLAKWHNDPDENFGDNFIYYTLSYGDFERLEMMKEALDKGLEFLFKSMAELAYVPRHPSVASVLEEGMKKYPDLRQLLLHTLYSLDHPPKK